MLPLKNPPSRKENKGKYKDLNMTKLTEVKVPMLPESIADATISAWHKKAGDTVSRDENLMDLETDKVMLEVPSPVAGIIKEILKKTGDTVQANQVVATIEEGAVAASSPPTSAPAAVPSTPTATTKPASDRPAPAAALSPAVRRIVAEHDVNISAVTGTGKGGRITKENIMTAIQTPTTERLEKRVPMTRMRARIAERLLEVTQTTAMLTTFNEINLQEVVALRTKYKDKFEKTHHARLGFMSFFVKASVEALKRFPAVNASIDGSDIVYHNYFDIGVAVSTDRGLVVPILRNADQMSMAEIELAIVDYANKAKAGKLTLEEMQGGTFTITNGGVFGSLLSTPILNSPQSAILGMHKIDQRPVVEDGQIVIRPMMYVAMSYDHRIIDGKDSVTFLVAIKELLEDPARLLLEI
jgi:2-oxoglutarate dehydrogenase E2 component (dihydrolipoamide succinyltransferase)